MTPPLDRDPPGPRSSLAAAADASWRALVQQLQAMARSRQPTIAVDLNAEQRAALRTPRPEAP